MNGLNAMKSRPMTVTESFEVNLPSFYDCQSQLVMIEMIIATG